MFEGVEGALNVLRNRNMDETNPYTYNNDLL